MSKEFGSESVVIVRADNTPANDPIIESRRARGTPDALTQVTTDGDGLLQIVAKGYNGTTYDTAAEIQFSVDGTPGASADMPGRIAFLTTPDNSATPAERMRIDSAGNVGIGQTTPLANLHFNYEERINGSASPADINRYYYHKVVQQVTCTSWTTIKTLTPSAIGGTFQEGFVEFHIMGQTNGVGFSSIFSRWRYYSDANVNGGVPAANVIGTNQATSGTPAGVRLNISGNDVQIQVQSPNGTNIMYSTVVLDIYSASGEGAQITWTLT